jgi:hypothetical protein
MENLKKVKLHIHLHTLQYINNNIIMNMKYRHRKYSAE